MNGRELAINRYLTRMQKRIRANMQREGVNATGATSRSIYAHTESDTSGQLEASPVLEKTETGQKPGSRVTGLIIFDWAMAKGIDFDMKTSFFVAESIKLRGTATFRMGGRKDIYTNVVEDEKELDRFLSDYQKATILEIDEIFANIAKIRRQ